MARVRLTRRYFTRFGRAMLESLGVGGTIVSVLAVVAPELLEGQWWILFASLALATLWGLYRLRERRVIQEYRENVAVRLVIGDLFEQEASAMVGMTTTFDTSVPDVIAPSSVQAAFLDKIYKNSVGRLDKDLEMALGEIQPQYTTKKPGKTAVYPLGTVAVLPSARGINYYCVAYTSMDQHNQASGTTRGVLDSLDAVWDAADKHGNGAPICLPLIGQGQSRIPELTPEVSVRLIVISFMLRTRRGRFASELRIVIHPDEASKVDPLEFQAFLKSLASA